jgi:dienelactone hydrolase
VGELRPAGLRAADLEVSPAGLLALAGVGALVGAAWALYQGRFVTRVPAAELPALLRPCYRVRRPNSPGPFSTAILVPGCVGAHAHADGWAVHVAQQGWAAVVVDSHTPRGWNTPDALKRICTGRMFWGTARAGDVLVALDDTRRMPFVDPARIVLVGWSHGAWAVMDLLALDPPRRLPFNVTDLPRGFAARGFKGVVGVFLFYPYCGLGNRARAAGWRHPAPVEFLLAGADTIVRNEACLAVADRLRGRGQPVEVHTLPGVNHGFDDTFTYPGSPLVHDPAATAEAKALLAAFLRRRRGASGFSARERTPTSAR